MIDRRTFLVTLAGGLLAAPLAAEAEQAVKVWRIGILASAPTPPLPQAFVQGLQDRGYVEGRNLVLDWRWSKGRSERFHDLAAELVRLKVDLIVVVVNEAALAAKRATETIPIVMVGSFSPDRVGLVDSLVRPGGNVTGMSNDTGPENAGKMLQFLKEAVPKASRVTIIVEANRGVTLNAWADQTGRIVKDIEAAGHGLGLTLQAVPVRDASEFPRAFRSIINTHTEALLVAASGLTFVHRGAIAEFAATHRLPAIYSFRQSAEDGGLMAYAVDLADQYRRAGGYVDRIFKGAKPADLPVEQPTKFELVINLKTAKALGLTIPQSFLLRADQVIQ